MLQSTVRRTWAPRGQTPILASYAFTISSLRSPRLRSLRYSVGSGLCSTSSSTILPLKIVNCSLTGCCGRTAARSRWSSTGCTSTRPRPSDYVIPSSGRLNATCRSSKELFTNQYMIWLPIATSDKGRDQCIACGFTRNSFHIRRTSTPSTTPCLANRSTAASQESRI
jgi:hypothetical protein